MGSVIAKNIKVIIITAMVSVIVTMVLIAIVLAGWGVTPIPITVDLVSLVSWFLTAVSFTLFLSEKRKNSKLPSYMAVQGILRACDEKAKFYLAHLNRIKKQDDSKGTPKEEYLLFADTTYSDYIALREHVMGTLKTIEPEKDIPFDAKGFIKNEPKTA